MLTAVTGIKWGDEGKGRVIDLLAERADIVVRYQGGNNAGHTVVTKQGKFILNLLPSGILHPNVVCVLADGMVVDLEHLSNEIADIRGKGVSVTPQNFKLSARATISMPWHRIQDDLEEERLAQSGVAFGSTRRGIAYDYSDKYRKKTLRLGDLLHLDEPYIHDNYTSGDIDLIVPEGEVFAMGDNREKSLDSRYEEVGLVKEKDIMGKVMIRLFPFNKIGTVS